MEIGDRQQRTLGEIEESNFRNLLKLGPILGLLVLGCIVFILHRTHIISQLMYNYIAARYDYTITYNDKYIMFMKDNSIILFRQDKAEPEDENESMYELENSQEKVRTVEEILTNIDNRYDIIKSQKLGYKDSNGYYMIAIENNRGTTQIRYSSDMPLNDKEEILSIIQKKPITTFTSNIYTGSSKTINDEVRENNEFRKRRADIKLGYIEVNKQSSQGYKPKLPFFMRDKLNHTIRLEWLSTYKPNLRERLKTLEFRNIQIKQYSTYTNIVVTENGVIAGTVENDSKMSKKLDKIINKFVTLAKLRDKAIIY